MVGTILKVMIPSALLAIAIKALASELPLIPTTPIVLTTICLPSVAMAIGLGWRWQRKRV